MTAIVNPSIFKFLTDLKKNNTREWFAENKEYYQREEEQIKDFFTAINEGLSTIDNIGGMKAYRMGVFRELGHFDSYDSIGTELAIYAAKSGKKIAQVDVKTRRRNDASRFGRRFSANQKIFRALWIGVFKPANQ